MELPHQTLPESRLPHLAGASRLQRHVAPVLLRVCHAVLCPQPRGVAPAELAGAAFPNTDALAAAAAPLGAQLHVGVCHPNLHLCCMQLPQRPWEVELHVAGSDVHPVPCKNGHLLRDGVSGQVLAVLTLQYHLQRLAAADWHPLGALLQHLLQAGARIERHPQLCCHHHSHLPEVHTQPRAVLHRSGSHLLLPEEAPLDAVVRVRGAAGVRGQPHLLGVVDIVSRRISRQLHGRPVLLHRQLWCSS
mmetsp:Transcript_35000/g.99197  ORF Transcript_35000/g.99197 Transcript_35000/m.99197 type:complete len:247 (+) Transcript_35000:1174-1914(+)